MNQSDTSVMEKARPTTIGFSYLSLYNLSSVAGYFQGKPVLNLHKVGVAQAI